MKAYSYCSPKIGRGTHEAKRSKLYWQPCVFQQLGALLVVRYNNRRSRVRPDLIKRWLTGHTDDNDLEQLTSTGPFAGTLGSFTTGIRLRTRYQHLSDRVAADYPHTPTIIWASDSNRVIETAKHFAAGFFGLDYDTTDTARLEVISEHSSQAANTLTPGRTCLANKRDQKEGQPKGYRLIGEYRAIYMPPIRERLLEQTGMDFSDHEIYAMQEMCGFETTVRGRSDWCNVFTRDEFLSFEYARDILHYYRAGPGQKYAASMGWLWLNATTNLLLEGPEAGPLFFSL
jgi:acid phosphatase